MILNARNCIKIFDKSIEDYHKSEDINQAENNPYISNSFEFYLYSKNWIDTIQWHLEDIMRIPQLGSDVFIETKQRIDRLNQKRVDLVEKIDDIFLEYFQNYLVPSAPINSETPAWILDRLSILRLKIWHMREQTLRTDVPEEHTEQCAVKLNILMDQNEDLVRCYDQLHAEIIDGKRKFKLYRQMKMYNDKNLNPQLYKKSE